MDLATVPKAAPPRPAHGINADATLAARIVPGRVCIVGRWSEPDRLSFTFLTKTGEWLSFTGAELRESTWWQSLAAPDVVMLEAHLPAAPGGCNAAPQ